MATVQGDPAVNAVALPRAPLASVCSDRKTKSAKIVLDDANPLLYNKVEEKEEGDESAAWRA
jgi:hypothetical protein